MLNELSNKIVAVIRFANACIFLSMLMLMFIQVITRYVINYSINWSGEVIIFLFIISTFMGTSVAVHQKSNVEINVWPVIIGRSSLKTHFAIDAVVQMIANILCIVFIAVFSWFLYIYAKQAHMFGYTSPALDLPLSIIITGMMVASIFMVLLLAIQIINGISAYIKRPPL